MSEKRKRIGALARKTVILALFCVLVVAVISIKLESVNMAEVKSEVFGSISNHLTLYITASVLLILLMSFGRARSAFRYAFKESFLRNTECLLSAGIILAALGFLASLEIPHFPNHPHGFFYAGILLTIVGAISFYFTHSKEQAPDRMGSLQPDIEIATKEELSEDQTLVYEHLTEIIEKEPSIRSISLYGAWGSGKSSIMNVVKKEILNKKTNLIWVQFEPWRYNSQEALTLGFYETLGNAIEEKISGFQNSAHSLVNLALPLVSKVDSGNIIVALIKGIGNIFNAKNRLPEDYIEQILTRWNKDLIVVIDDVERIYEPAHIYRTLQLAHFLKNSNRVRYIFITEEEKLLKCVPPHHQDDAVTYIEKFIEMEISLTNPDLTKLRAYLNKLLEQHALSDFDTDNIANSIIENTKTYRGMLKTFNKFIFKLKDRFYSDGAYTIDLNQKYILDYIAIKYPLLWSHIQDMRTRPMYVGRPTDWEWAMRESFRNLKDSQEMQEARINGVLQPLNLNNDEREQIIDILGSLFPYFKAPDSGYVQDVSSHRLLEEKKVGHPDILDLYFANSQPYARFVEIRNAVKKLLSELEKADPGHYKTLIENNFERGAEENADFIFQLKTAILALKGSKTKRKQYIRALFNAYISSAGYISRRRNDVNLTYILSMIDEEGRTHYNDTQALIQYLEYVFTHIEQYKPHPSVSVRIGLYLDPDRDNHFVSFSKWGAGYNRLKKRLLKTIDDYYLKDNRVDLLFSESVDQEWRFVFYQWALSIRAGEISSELYGSKARHKKANDLIFRALNHDKKMAYKRLLEDFYYKEWDSDEKESWHINNKSLAPYDINKLIKFVRKLTESEELNRGERAMMAEMLKLLGKYRQKQ